MTATRERVGIGDRSVLRILSGVTWAAVRERSNQICAEYCIFDFAGTRKFCREQSLAELSGLSHNLTDPPQSLYSEPDVGDALLDRNRNSLKMILK